MAALRSILLDADRFVCDGGAQGDGPVDDPSCAIRWVPESLGPQAGRRKRGVSVFQPFIEYYASGRSRPAGHRKSRAVRTLTETHDSEVFNLGHNPGMDPELVSMMFSPAAGRRVPLVCPDPKMRPLDDCLKKAFDANCTLAHLTNTTTILSYALDKMRTDGGGSREAHRHKEYLAALKAAVAYIARTAGQMSNVLVMARRKLWLKQSTLPEDMQRTLLNLPSHVRDTTLFGPGAQVTLDDLQADVEVHRARKQLGIGLQRPVRKAPYSRPSTHRPSTYAGKAHKSGWTSAEPPHQRRARGADAQSHAQSHTFRKPKGRHPAKPSAGRNQPSGAVSGNRD